MLPQPVIDLLVATFPGIALSDLTPTSGGYSHHTAFITLGTRRCVVKAASHPARRADLRHEAIVLGLLEQALLPAPRLLTLAENADWSVAVTLAEPGINGLQLLQGDPQELEQVYRALGSCLAAVHRLPLVLPTPDLLITARTSAAAARIPSFELAPALQADLLASLTHPVWQPAALTLIHGDAGLHNILWDGKLTVLLDWEWAGWGNPLLDLAWLYWTIQWRRLPATCWYAVLEAYGTPPSAPLEAWQALVFGQIATILARVQEQPPAWDEWVRRLHWTRELEFAPF